MAASPTAGEIAPAKPPTPALGSHDFWKAFSCCRVVMMVARPLSICQVAPPSFEYQKTLMTAFAEVSTSLSSIERMDLIVEQRASQRDALAKVVEESEPLVVVPPLRAAGHEAARVFAQVRGEFPDIEATHLYIDALAMFLVQNPGQFQVIVTNNLFGDIITDIGGALQGGLGLAASGNLHPGRTSMFEPVHGSAPPLAGTDVANPIGAILSAALMLETLGRQEDARRVEQAVEAAVAAGEVTVDAGGTLGTRAAAAAVLRRLG